MQVNQYAPNVVQGMLSLLKNCPHEVAHLRRDPTWWSTRDAVRSMAYSILVRGKLSLNHLSLAVQLFSKNVHDPTLPVTIQKVSYKPLLNLMESNRVKTEQDLTVSVHMGVAYPCWLVS